MDRPKVLIFNDWYTPGYKAGGPVRGMVNMVDHTRDRFDYHIITRNTEYTEEEPYPGITPDTWTTLPGGERVWYASKQGTSAATWRRLLKQEKWNVIYINGLYSWWYNILPLWLTRNTAALRIVGVCGMLASGALVHGTVKKMLFLSLARMVDLYKGVRFHATNEEEAGDVRKHVLRHADVPVVPNLPRKSTVEHPRAPKEPGAVKLVSIARIAVEKNTLFAITSLMRVKGTVDFNLYGPVYDESYWAKCQEAIAQLPAHVRVRYLGNLPSEEVLPVLAAHHALYMPSLGENFGHTMLEAVSVGCPLLISNRTPWRKLEARKAGWDLPLDRPAAFTETVERLCSMDAEAYAPWAAGALALGAERLNDPQAMADTLELLRKP